MRQHAREGSTANGVPQRTIAAVEPSVWFCDTVSPLLDVGPTPGAQIKGAALVEFVRWFARDFGTQVLVDRVALLPAPLQRELGIDPSNPTLGILASRWYGSRSIGVLLDAITAEADPAEVSRMADAAANAIMGATLRGVYRLLFEWLATPARYAQFCNRLWRSYHDTGTMKIEHTSPTRAVCSIADWSGHHPFLCAVCRGSAEVIYREMGCRSVTTTRTSCVDEGADACRFVTQWSP